MKSSIKGKPSWDSGDSMWRDLFPCIRCGIDLTIPDTFCHTCQSARKHRQRNQDDYMIPSFEIHIYTMTGMSDMSGRNVHACRNANMAYWLEDMADDVYAAAYIIDLAGHLPRCYVTVSEPGELLDHWEGWQPDRLQAWIAKARTETHELAA